jgi:hydroxypyruvate reductase
VSLAAAREIAGLEKVVFISLATDGEDGPTDAAGAVVTGETMAAAAAHNLDAADYLARNDSYHFFEPLGALVRIGPTGTNVNDLSFLFAL